MLKFVRNFLLRVLGDIKIYPFPMFVVYDPSTYRVKGYHTRQAMEILQPGDIVMRKYVHYLDGYFIPGEFSHSSIYVGNGKIVHAIAEGVQLIDVIDFLRCDGFCIMRPKDKEAAAAAIEMAESFIGIPYDFGFIDGEEAFYCHELTATCYPTLNIQKKPVRIFGMKLKPRYVCDSFLENENLELVVKVLPERNHQISDDI